MQERYLINVLAITLSPEGEEEWRHGIIPFKTRYDLMHRPLGVPITMNIQLLNVPEGVEFPLEHILEDLTTHHWDQFRSLS